jgi:hypothetical protein
MGEVAKKQTAKLRNYYLELHTEQHWICSKAFFLVCACVCVCVCVCVFGILFTCSNC